MLVLNAFCFFINIAWISSLGLGNPMSLIPALLIACTVPNTIKEIKKL